MDNELEQKLAKIKREMPGRLKKLQERRRLLDLAKSSPVAINHTDFLELMEVKQSADESEYELVKTVVEAVERKEGDGLSSQP